MLLLYLSRSAGRAAQGGHKRLPTEAASTASTDWTARTGPLAVLCFWADHGSHPSWCSHLRALANGVEKRAIGVQTAGQLPVSYS